MTTGIERRRLLQGGAAALSLLGLGACSSGDGRTSATSAGGTVDGAEAGSTATTRSTPTARPASTRPTPAKGSSRVIVLGSHGGQQINQLTGAGDRAGSSLLIDVDGELTVIDSGCGSVHRLAEAGYDANAVRNVFVTHCHADHVAETGSLASFVWSSGRNGGDPNRRLDLYGPTGMYDVEDGTKLALRRSIADQEGPLAQRPVFDEFAVWHEFEPPAEITTLLDDPGLKVEALKVTHGQLPAVGYRVTIPEGVIAISGDRGAGKDDFVDLARGADVLVHEVINRPLIEAGLRGKAAESFISHLVEDHTDAPDVGRLATEAGVEHLVLYHLIPANSNVVSDQAWIDLVRPTYDGRITVAHDLDTIVGTPT